MCFLHTLQNLEKFRLIIPSYKHQYGEINTLLIIEPNILAKPVQVATIPTIVYNPVVRSLSAVSLNLFPDNPQKIKVEGSRILQRAATIGGKPLPQNRKIRNLQFYQNLACARNIPYKGFDQCTQKVKGINYMYNKKPRQLFNVIASTFGSFVKSK